MPEDTDEIGALFAEMEAIKKARGSREIGHATVRQVPCSDLESMSAKQCALILMFQLHISPAMNAIPQQRPTISLLPRDMSTRNDQHT